MIEQSAPAAASVDRTGDPDRQAAAVFDPATAARLAALDAASDEHAAAQRPANTIRSYAADWKAWAKYTAAKQLPELAATRGTLRGFVHWLWHDVGAAPSTIDRRLAGVVVTLRREHRVLVNADDTAAARELLKDYVSNAAEKKEAPRGRGQAEALTLADLRKISAACPDTLAGIRDRALVLVAFAVAARRSEAAGLLVLDVADDPHGLVVDVRVTKTRPRQVAVPYGSDPLTCPVRAWQAWKTAAGLAAEPESAAFRRVDRHDRMLGELSGEGAGQIVTRAGKRAKVTVHLTGHSVRAGLATAARAAGKDRKAIADTTGHAPGSPVLDKYLRTVDRWSPAENALIGIGL
jgi:integrase